MRSLTLLAAACLLLTAARLPAQIARPSTVSLPLSNSILANSAAVAPRISIADVEDRHERRLKFVWIASIFAMAAA
ncbi:MAG: hypothetical protein ACRD9W_29995, partial [Terriglobia bacterium]